MLWLWWIGFRIRESGVKMRRTGRNKSLWDSGLEQAFSKSPKTYKHLHLICFGFPCQDISGANSKAVGIKGERSSVFFECWRIVELLTPKWVLIENVPRLLSINGGRDMATVLQTMAKGGYGWAYRVLDSQYFGVAQRRKRVFIIGCFGKIPPPEILFEPQGSRRNDKKKRKIWSRGLCISTKDGERQDPTAETYIANVIQATDYKKTQHGQFGNEGNLVAQCLSANEFAGDITAKGRTRNIVAQTIGATPRGNVSFVWQDTHIAEINPKRKGKTTRVSKGLDSRRGVLIGNAVTVNVAEWIGKRILKYGN
ncbi:MAG TPA: DNA (cytosine-5-)-methyltransferase [bacterium]|nr:DNA (cytosine-5-)-methyltransferase [bacterium]